MQLRWEIRFLRDLSFMHQKRRGSAALRVLPWRRVNFAHFKQINIRSLFIAFIARWRLLFHIIILIKNGK